MLRISTRQAALAGIAGERRDTLSGHTQAVVMGFRQKRSNIADTQKSAKETE